jgi:hypothetical protein
VSNISEIPEQSQRFWVTKVSDFQAEISPTYREIFAYLGR